MSRPTHRKTHTNTRGGFTLLELMIVMVIIGAVSAMGVPKMQYMLLRSSVRAARGQVAALANRTRGAAVTRGCAATLHLAAGTSAQAWVTACDSTGTTIDTVGNVEYLSERFAVSMTTTIDSIRYYPNGIAESGSQIDLTFARSTEVNSLTITSVGRLTW